MAKIWPRHTHPRYVEVAGYRSDVDKGALGFDQKRRKCLGDSQRAPNIGVEDALCGVDILVQQRHEMVAAGVIDQVVQRCPSFSLDCLDSDVNVGCIGYIEHQHRHVRQLGEFRRLRGIAKCGKDVEITCLEGDS